MTDPIDARDLLALYDEIAADDFDSRAMAMVVPFGETRAKKTPIQNIVANTIIDGFIKGTLTNFPTTVSYQPIPMFTNDAATHMYTTAPGNIIKPTANTGLQLKIPVRYEVVIVGSFEAALNEDYNFTILVDGTEIDLCAPIMATGRGNGKYAPFSVNGFTDVITPDSIVSLGVKDGGANLDTISGAMTIKFAGLS